MEEVSDLLDDLDNFSRVSNTSGDGEGDSMNANRKVSSSKMNYFASIMNFKLKKCHNEKKTEELLKYLEDLQKYFLLASKKVQSCEINEVITTNRSIVGEVLKTNKYENEMEKVNPELQKLISSKIKEVKQEVALYSTDLNTIKKLEIWTSVIEEKILD